MIEENNINNEEIKETEELEEVEDTEAIQEDLETTEEEVVEQPALKNNEYELNLRELREARRRDKERAEQAEYERDQLLKHFKSQNQQYQQQQQQQQQSSLGIADDDYVNGKHLGKVANTVEGLKREVMEWKAHNEEITAELKLTSEFSDFNNIVTPENIKALLNDYPELRATIVNGNPLYDRAKATYRLIKKFSRPIQQPMNINNEKPRSVSTLKAKSSISDVGMYANGYTEEQKNALRREMDEAISRAN